MISRSTHCVYELLVSVFGVLWYATLLSLLRNIIIIIVLVVVIFIIFIAFFTVFRFVYHHCCWLRVLLIYVVITFLLSSLLISLGSINTTHVGKFNLVLINYTAFFCYRAFNFSIIANNCLYFCWSCVLPISWIFPPQTNASVSIVPGCEIWRTFDRKTWSLNRYNTIYHNYY